jgi:hypothetical protein
MFAFYRSIKNQERGKKHSLLQECELYYFLCGLSCAGAIAQVPIEQIAELGERFTEIYLKKPVNVSLVLGLLDEYDFHVRWPAVKLLTHLILNK